MNSRFNKVGWRLLPGSFMALLFAFLLKLGALESPEQLAQTGLFHLRGQSSWDDRVVVIAIDETSIQKLGWFPWKRQYYVTLLEILAKAEPNIVAFDLIFSEPTDDDPKFAQTLMQKGNVVLAQAQDVLGLPLLPTPSLASAAIATGHILNTRDPDGVTRRIDLHRNNEPTLGLATVRAYAFTQQEIPLPNLEQPLWINWNGRARQMPKYSFVDVINQKVPLKTFQNKIILVGVTAAGIDPLITPFDRNPAASGVHLHATVINNLLQGNGLQRLPEKGVWFLMLLGGPGFGWLISRRREDWQIIFWSGACLGWGALSLVFFHFHYWLPVVLPIGLVSLTTITTIVSDRWRNYLLLQRQIQKLWQTHQQDLVISNPTIPSQIAPLLRQNIDQQSITRLAMLAEQFGRSQSAQAAIARSLSLGLLAIDLDERIWFCNPMAASWLHVQVGDCLTPHLIPQWLSPDQWQADLQALRDGAEVSAKTLSQDDRWFEIKLEPLRYSPFDRLEQATRLDGFLIVLEDITTRKQAETVLEKQVAELQRLNYLKDDFLSTVSHELRAPMANIKMAIELLKITRSPETTEHYLKILQTECKRETDLINDLLDLQRLEAGAQKFYPEPIDLQNWLPPIIEPFYQRIDTQQQTLKVTLNTSLPKLLTDQSSLERIVIELINNACKYTPPTGIITVVTNWLPPHVELVVQNSGVEIPNTELPRIFDKFYRVPHADPWKRGGTGLGLALVKKLVTCLGGNITVKSEAGHTTFTVQLPVDYHWNGDEQN
jgi:signal transduction histidine kinase/CHASE2 domain-containing sensor protein